MKQIDSSLVILVGDTIIPPQPIVILPKRLHSIKINTKDISDSNRFVFEGSSDDDNETTLIASNPDADRTVILYITPWEPAWGGFTHFIRSDKDHSVIAPVLGRLVNFQSKLIHKAYAYCNSNCPIRITAAFKLKL